MSRCTAFRFPLRSLAGLCALGLVVLAGAATARAVEDDLVPQGVWGVRLTHGERTEEEAITRLNAEGPLLEYAVPDPGRHDAIEGTLQRDVERTELALTLGLTDTWNLRLRAPHVSVTQTSTLRPASADPAVQAEVERLESRTESGLGHLELTSLHRSVFTDRHAYVWGYGYGWPGADPVSPWRGRGTLQLDPPFERVHVVLHYTFFPYIRRARLDLRANVGRVLETELEVPGGDKVGVDPGDDAELSLAWQQELGPVVAGLGFVMFQQGRSTLAGAEQEDSVQDYRGRLTLGFGNLRALERAPIAFPYVLLLTYDHTVQGFNTPLVREVRLSLQTWF